MSDAPRVGTVHLVGAGPGDPELITVRGRDLLAAAGAVVVDALANHELLEWCREGVEIHDVGKRAGEHSATQEEINQLLVELAQRGLRVIRLKGGDPFVFGRGGEEVEALAAQGIPVEVVPGVTSAIAAPAAAGIPVTHRDWSSHVTVVTGHERDDTDGGRIDMEALASLLRSGTLVFLMGARALPRIVEDLLRSGADPTTPAAAVQWGTDPRQSSTVATLGRIVEAVEHAGMGAPMVTVIGRVAALGDDPAWLRRPLQGRRILVTRARAQASGFLERLRRMGADAVELPVIATEPQAEREQLRAALLRLAEPHPVGRFVVFSSAVAVRMVLDAVAEAGRDARIFAGTRIAAVGPETAAELAVGGLHADLVPDEYVADAVADLLERTGVRGAHVWLPRAARARDSIPDRLKAAGAEVEVLPLYRTVLPEGASATLREQLAVGPVDAVTFTSSSTVENFMTALDGAPFPPGAIAACIGPATAATARAAGLPVALVATEHTTAGLAEALAAHFAATPSPAAQSVP